MNARKFHEEAQTYFNQQNFLAAIKCLDQAIAEYSKDVDKAAAYLDRGLTNFVAKNFVIALADYDQAIALYQDDADKATAYFNRGTVKSSLNSQAAYYDYAKAIELFPNDVDKAEVYFNRSALHHSQNNDSDAIVDATKAIELFLSDADKAGSYFNRSIILYGLDNYPAAVADATQAIALYPNEADKAKIYLHRSNIRYYQKKIRLAIADATHAIALFPEDADKAKAYNYRSIYHYKLSDYAKAIEDANQAILLCSEYAIKANAYVNRGKANHAMGDSSASFSDFTQAYSYHQMDVEKNIKTINNKVSQNSLIINLEILIEAGVRINKHPQKSLILNALSSVNELDARKNLASKLTKFITQYNPEELLPLAAKINNLMMVNKISFHASLALTKSELQVWFMQGIQLVQQGKLHDSTFYLIASFVSPMTEQESKALIFPMHKQHISNTFNYRYKNSGFYLFFKNSHALYVAEDCLTKKNKLELKQFLNEAEGKLQSQKDKDSFIEVLRKPFKRMMS